MSELVTNTAKLLPYTKRGKAVPSFATAYYYEPEPGAPQVGTLFVVIEVLAPSRQAEAVADLLIKAAGESFYNAEAGANNSTSAAETDAEDEAGTQPPLDCLRRFELAIKNVNRELAEYTERGYAGWVGRMSAVIAVFADHELHITQTGSADALLRRDGHLSRIAQDLSPKGPHRPAHTFSNIASGQLAEGDRLVLATPALLHTIPEPRLNNLIGDNSPQAAASKIAELVSRQDNADRVAALLVELTTTELLAMTTSSGDPDEVSVGQPDSLLDTARVTAKPLVARGVTAAKGVGGLWQNKLRPAAKRLGQASLSALVGLVSKKGGRLILFGLLAAGLIAGFGWRLNAQRRAEIDRLVQRYEAVINQQQQATTLFEAGDKASAKALYGQAKTQLDELTREKRVAELEATLKSRSHPEDQPTELVVLAKQIQTQLDLLEGLVQATPTAVADFATAGLVPAHLELIGGRVIAVGESDNPDIAVWDPANSKLETVTKAPAGFGRAVATSTSTAGDAIYILTSQPSVWYFKPGGNLVRQVAAGDGWAKGSDIAAYGGNLYILADNQVWRYTPTITGFSIRQAYFPAAAAASSTAGATTFAIDGSVYLAGGQPPLRRYLMGKLEQSAADLPAALSQPAWVQSTSDGTLIMLLDKDSGRLGLVSFSPGELRFVRQIQLAGDKPRAAVYDERAKLMYVLAGNKLHKLALPK